MRMLESLEPLEGEVAAPIPAPDIGPILSMTGMPDFPLARSFLVHRLRTDGVSDDVLDAFSAVPRHCFAPAARWVVAYLDLDLRVGLTWLNGPRTIARVLDGMPRLPRMRVLEVGTCTGYQTALLSLLHPYVHSMDSSRACIEWARTRLLAMGRLGVTWRHEDVMARGCTLSEFDCVIVNVALPRIHPNLLGAVASSGGVVIAPLRNADGTQRLIRCALDSGRVVQMIDMGPCCYPTYTSARAPMAPGR